MTPRSWPPPGVAELLAADERVERVPADAEYARDVVERVSQEELVLALFAATREHWSKVNTLTYDAARKAVEALLLSSGWRVRAVPGSHACVGEVVDRWLSSEPDPAERIAAKFAASRKARREDEYPHPASRQRTSSELRVLAQDNVRLVNLVRGWLGLEPQLHLVPTDANVRDFGG